MKLKIPSQTCRGRESVKIHSTYRDAFMSRYLGITGPVLTLTVVSDKFRKCGKPKESCVLVINMKSMAKS